MSHRDMAACLFAGLTLASAAGLAWALRSCLKGRPGGTGAVLLLGAGVLCRLYAAVGWGWYLATGLLR